LKKTLGAFRRPFKLAAAFKPRGIGQKTLCTVGNASAGKRVAREREGKNGAGRNREQARELEAGPTNRPHDSRGGATSRASASLASRGAPVAPPPPASPAAAPPASRLPLLLPAGPLEASTAAPPCRGPSRVRLPGDPSASRPPPCRGPVRLPAGDPSASRRCSSAPPCRRPKPPRSVPSPARCSFLPLAPPPPAPLPCSSPLLWMTGSACMCMCLPLCLNPALNKSLNA